MKDFMSLLPMFEGQKMSKNSQMRDGMDHEDIWINSQRAVNMSLRQRIPVFLYEPQPDSVHFFEDPLSWTSNHNKKKKTLT